MLHQPDLAELVDLTVGHRMGTVAEIGYCNTMAGTVAHNRTGGIAGYNPGAVFVGTEEGVAAVVVVAAAADRVVLFGWERRVGCPNLVWVPVAVAVAVVVG